MYRFHQSCRKKAAAGAKEIHGSAMGFVANWYNLIDIREYLRESLLAFLYILFNWIVAKLTSETIGILQTSIKIDELNIIIVKKHCSIRLSVTSFPYTSPLWFCSRRNDNEKK